MKYGQPDNGEGYKAVHQKLINFAAPIKCSIEHIVHPRKSYAKDAHG